MTQSEVTEAAVEALDGGNPQETPEQRFEQRLAELDDRLFIQESELRGVKGIAQRAETVTLNTTAAIASLQESLEERYAPKRALVLLEQTVRSSLGDEAWEKFERDGELAELKAAVKRPPAPKEEPKAIVQDPADIRQGEWDVHYGPLAKKYAERRGVDFDAAKNSFTKFRPAWPDLMEDWEKHVDALEDATKTTAPTRTEIDQSLGGGGTKDGWANYQKALKEGTTLPSPAEIDRITAGHFAAV